jgi:ketosteroid isomerase-like protein
MEFLALFVLLQAPTPADTLRRLDSLWARSYATNDTVLGGKLFDDSLVVTSSNGRVRDKKSEMADVGPTPGGQIHYFRTSDVQARAYGSAGYVVGLAEWSYTYNGRKGDYRRRYTAVYARGGPLGWRMVALHIGPAPE